MPRILLTYIFIVFSVLTAFSAARYEVDIPGVDASGIGVYIEDLVNPEVVLDVNGEIPLIPASSSLKLIAFGLVRLLLFHCLRFYLLMTAGS